MQGLLELADIAYVGPGVLAASLAMDKCVFKDVMLGKHRLIFSMLDPSVTLLFDSANFTHWNGATVIEMLLLAHEMTAQNKEISKIVEGLEC